MFKFVFENIILNLTDSEMNSFFFASKPVFVRIFPARKFFFSHQDI